MATDSGGTHQADGISVDENNVLERLGPSVFTGKGQQDVTAGVSPCNIMCRCAQQQQFDFVCSTQVRLVKTVCARHSSANGDSILSTCNKLEKYIKWLPDNTNELAFSNVTSTTASSGGDSTNTIVLLFSFSLFSLPFNSRLSQT